jgi:CheY-like chemotaxis protein
MSDTLPPPARRSVASPASGEASVVKDAKERPRALIIDDEPAVCLSLHRALRDEYDVVTTSSALEALRLLQSAEPFDIVLCDLLMTELTGDELYEVVRRRSPEVAQRFVFLTGGALTRKFRAFLDRVPNECIDKLASMQVLRALLRKTRLSSAPPSRRGRVS